MSYYFNLIFPEPLKLSTEPGLELVLVECLSGIQEALGSISSTIEVAWWPHL